MANVVNPYSFVPLGTAPVRTSLDACYTGPLLTGRQGSLFEGAGCEAD